MEGCSQLESSLGNDILVHCLGYLNGNDLNHAVILNRSFCDVITGSETLWNNLLENELGYSRHSQPISDGRQRYFQKRNEFSGYSGEEIKLANLWWQRMIDWFSLHTPSITRTINPPATDEAIAVAERALNRPMPRMLKLLYKFHNGQSLQSDSIVFGTNDEEQDRELTSNFHCGMFGHYSFYDHSVFMRMLPLTHMTLLTNFAGKCPLTVIPRPHSSIHTDNSKSSSSNSNSSSNTNSNTNTNTNAGSNPNTAKSRDAYIPANHDKWVFLCSTGPRFNRLFMASEENIFVNFEMFNHLIPAVDESHLKNSLSAAGRVGGALFEWLYEYLHRLETGVYGTLSIYDGADEELAPHESNATSGGLTDDKSDHCISLFPIPNRCNSNRASNQINNNNNAANALMQLMKQEHVTGVNVSNGSSCSSLDDLSANTSSCVSDNGIRIEASSLFVPEQSRKGTLLFTYSISIDLVHSEQPSNTDFDAENIHGKSSSSCNSGGVKSRNKFFSRSPRYQLVSRHWDIASIRNTNKRTSEQASLLNNIGVEQVDGAGVIGLYPVLDPNKPRRWPFRYQSCSPSRSFPSSLSGHLDFFPLTSSEAPHSVEYLSQAGEQSVSAEAAERHTKGSVSAHVNPVLFTVPTFIF